MLNSDLMTLAPDRDLTSSTVLQGFNSSSLGELLSHESLVLHMVRKQKRLVNELRMKVASERKLEDQSCWRSLIHEHFGKKFRRENVQKPETTRAFWNMKVWEALQRGQYPKELSFEEFLEVLRLVKPNVATGRDNVPGTILRFLRGYSAIVQRLARREDAHVRSWTEFDICFVPKKGDISKLSNWRPISLVPTLYKVYEMCMWKVLDKELRPLPSQLVVFRPGM